MAKSKTKPALPASKGSSVSLSLLDADEVRAPAKHPFVATDELNPLGGASQEDLLAVVTEQLGEDPNLEGSEGAIAVEGLARIISARMAHSGWQNDPKRLAVFFVSDRVRDLAASLDATKEPIIDNGSRTLTGLLWLTSPGFKSGHYLSLNSTAPAGVFEEVKAKGFGNRSAFVFDPTATEPEIRYYPDGVDNDTRVQRFLVSKSTFTLATFDAVMTLLYKQSMITPAATLAEFNPWKDASKYIPRPGAEALYQAMAKIALSVAFGPTCRVAFEVTGTEGRCDLLISSRKANNTWISHAALELKVLRSFTSSKAAVNEKTRKDAVAKGLRQVIAYKNENNAKDGLLCCYDMRTPNHCDGTEYLKAISTKAKTAKVELRSFRIFGSAEDYRAATYGSSSA
jgi:hypothetical protein